MAFVNQTYPLRLQTGDGLYVGLYPRAEVRNQSNQLLTTLAMTHVAGGLFTTDYTPPAVGYFLVVYTIFTNPGHTVASAYPRGAEAVQVISPIANRQGPLYGSSGSGFSGAP